MVLGLFLLIQFQITQSDQSLYLSFFATQFLGLRQFQGFVEKCDRTFKIG